MIAFISGVLHSKKENIAIIEVSGIGYLLYIPTSTYRHLPSVGESVTLHTLFQLREDDAKLFGFASEKERDVFQILMGVSGVGTKMALDILSHLPIERLVEAVQNDNHTMLCQVPGIGKKRAEKILFDLKRLSHPLLLTPVKTSQSSVISQSLSSTMKEAEEALIALGLKPLEAQRAIMAAASHVGRDAQVSALLKEALRHR